MTTFKELGLSEGILKGLTALGFETPSDIQEQAIPQLLEANKDFIGLAQTGTGKTAAFGLPLLECVDTSKKYTQGLVLAPTRELGQQIAEHLKLYSKFLEKINVLAVYGGAAISNQIKDLKRTQHIIIATPGRLIDLIERKAVKLDRLQFLVLDEADEMLNMGFKDELDKILSYTPDEKLTWLFSATMPVEIKKIVRKYMDNPNEVKINPKNEVNTNIEHQYVAVKEADKTETLTRFMDVNPEMRGIVFCRTKRDTQNLAEELLRKNYKADAIHGDLSQAQRDRVMKRFKAHHLQVLIATDVAARGIDVTDLTHVFHHKLPDDNSYYTHRSGRTARAGKKGISLVFINSRESHKITRLQKSLGISFEKVNIPETKDIVDIRIENWCNQIVEKEINNKITTELQDKVNSIFEPLTKEELIAKLLTTELSKFNINSTRNLNDTSKGKDRDRGDRNKEDRRGRRSDRDRDSRTSSRSDRRDRGDKRDRKDRSSRNDRDSRDRDSRDRDSRERKPSKKGGNPRYFINMGTRDKINKGELIDFICTIAKVKRSDIGDIDLKASFSFFEIDPKAEKQVISKFSGMTLDDGRELRVNRDN